MTLPQEKIGDKGQRYVVVFRGFHDHAPDLEHSLGYTDTLLGVHDLFQAVEIHPVWNSPRVIDRVKNEEEKNE